jgi:hypothetical protein
MFSLFYYDPLSLTKQVVSHHQEYYYLPTRSFKDNSPPGMMDPYSIEGIQQRSAMISKKVLNLK